MKIDLTYTLTKEKIAEWLSGLNDRDKGLMSFGHMGTHFDAMNKTFPLEFTESRGVIFDVSHIVDRDIEAADIDITKIRAGDFVLLRTGTIERYEYAGKDYSEKFPQVSWELIKIFVEKKVRIIGIDMRGLRKGGEHPKADQFCADNDTFVIENLVNLDKLIGVENFTVHTYPLNIRGFTGIPSRVVAEF